MTRSRQQCVSGQRCQPATWREALYCQATHHPTVRLRDVADGLDMEASTLSRMVNPDDDKPLPSRKLERLLALTPGHTPALAYLARQQQAVIVSLPAPDDTTRTKDVAGEVCAFGEYLRVKAVALGDARVTPAELVEIESYTWRVLAVIAAGLEAVRRAATPVSPFGQAGRG